VVAGIVKRVVAISTCNVGGKFTRSRFLAVAMLFALLLVELFEFVVLFLDPVLEVLSVDEWPPLELVVPLLEELPDVLEVPVLLWLEVMLPVESVMLLEEPVPLE
jgi:hypothetical protein